jgi:hypothetical protein
MNSTTITIGLVVLALAVGGWILLRGGRDDEEEVETAPSVPAAPVAPNQGQAAAVPRPPAAPTAAPTAAPMSSVPYGTGVPMAGAPMAGVPMTGQQMPGAPMAAQQMAGQQMGGAPMAPPPMTSAPLTTDAHAYEVRTRWQELQLRFVDDPQTAAGEAERLVDDALAGVTASLNARKDQLSSWRVSGRDDTEQLRAAVHGYRDFLNHLVGT